MEKKEADAKWHEKEFAGARDDILEMLQHQRTLCESDKKKDPSWPYVCKREATRSDYQHHIRVRNNALSSAISDLKQAPGASNKPL